jgi:hypothetical protein
LALLVLVCLVSVFVVVLLGWGVAVVGSGQRPLAPWR